MVLMSKREASIKVAEDYIRTSQRILELTAEKPRHLEASLLDNFGENWRNIARFCPFHYGPIHLPLISVRLPKLVVDRRDGLRERSILSLENTPPSV